jgi:hypothetical protein
MIPDLLDALVRPLSYKRFAAEKAARTASYIAFLSLIFVGCIGISVKLRLAPLFDQTFAWLETSMPVITFSSGTVTAVPPGPVRLEHPRAAEVALMIDTARKEPVTTQQMIDAKVLAYLTANALYLRRGPGPTDPLETIDLTKSAAEQPVTVNADSYKAMESAFDWVFYPSLMLFFFLSFALALAFCGLLYGVTGMALAGFAGKTPGFGALFRIGVHAQTAGSLLYALDSLLPKSIPYFQAVSIALSLTYLWLGVKAAGAPAEPPVPAA